MKQLQLTNETEVRHTISSIEVAEMLGKKHNELIRDIEGRKDGKGVGIIPVLTEGNFPLVDYFIESTYKDAKNETRKCYEITKMGCEILGNKQQGSKGILFTAKYVNRFNAMEQALKNNIPMLSQEQQVALQILDSGTDAILLREYKQIVEKRVKNGNERLMSLGQIVGEINKELGTNKLTTTILNEFMAEVLELGKYKRVGRDKYRSFVPNDKFMEIVTKEGASYTGVTYKKDKVRIQFSVDMLNTIMQYKGQLEQFITEKVGA